MAFFTVTLVSFVLIGLALWGRIVAARRFKVPLGLKQLPGPKGIMPILISAVPLTWYGHAHV
jgi:hypothetical protein